MRSTPASAAAASSSMLRIGARCHRDRDDKRDRPDPKG
jgi:hypothetical protein